MNKVILMGNLTQDPEIKMTTNGVKVATFGLATNEQVKVGDKWETKPTFHNIIAWKQKAELLEKYFSKGDKILIEGKITYNIWEKQDGTKGYKTEIVALNIEFTGKNKEKVDEFEESDKKHGIKNIKEEVDVDDLPF